MIRPSSHIRYPLTVSKKDFHITLGVFTVDPGYCVEYFFTSGRNLKTGSWLFCHETDYISVTNFTMSHQKVIWSRLVSRLEWNSEMADIILRMSGICHCVKMSFPYNPFKV